MCNAVPGQYTSLTFAFDTLQKDYFLIGILSLFTTALNKS